jgi:predicted nucleotidyltransferase
MNKEEIKRKLKEFTDNLKNFSEVIGVYYTGSTANETWDEYSDIDIDVVVKDKNYEKFVKKIPKILSWWGEVKLCNHYRGNDETYVYVGGNYLKIEIDPIKKSEIIQSLSKLKDVRIVYDKEKIMKKSYKKRKYNLDSKIFKLFLPNIRDQFIYLARHYTRGQKFSGITEITTIRYDLFYLLSQLKGLEMHELIRGAERSLLEKEKNMWYKTQCNSNEKKELKRAIMANWKLMKYIEKEFGGKTKKKLNLKCNDEEILKLIDKTLMK